MAPQTMVSANTLKTYKTHLKRLQEFRLNESFDLDHEWSDEELYAITPRDVCRFLKKKAYGTPDPGPRDRPIFARDEGLSYCKKAISFFLPNSLMQWNPQRQEGNPTRSKEVNKVIADVRLAQVRKQGKKSNAKRPLKKEEFEKTLRILEAGHDYYLESTRNCAIMKFQFHIILLGELKFPLEKAF